VQHLRNIKLPEVAAKYAELQKAVIGHRLQNLNEDIHNLESAQLVNSVIAAPIAPPFTELQLDLRDPVYAGMESDTWYPTSGDERFGH
jgi:hypothetical protein